MLKKLGRRPRFIVRGDKESHRADVRRRAEELGLKWQEIPKPAELSVAGILKALAQYSDADVYELCFYVPEEVIRVMYAGADCVLANSGHEPFGLVGLEVMACGGLVFVGATGEDYASNLVNCISVETSDPREMVVYLDEMQRDRGFFSAIRNNGRYTAEAFTWERVAADLFFKINYLARQRGVTVNE